MIFCKSRRFIFLRVPKTASTSLSLQIQNNIEFQPGDFATSFGAPTYGLLPPVGFNNVVSRIPTLGFRRSEHALLDELFYYGIVRDPKELEQYSIYGVMRDPIDRFFSMFTYLLDVWRGANVSKMKKEEIAKRAFELLESCEKPYEVKTNLAVTHNAGAFPILPQSRWLMLNNKPINNIIVYPHFDGLLTKLTGNPNLTYNEKIGKKPVQSEISDATIESIRKWYPDDFTLWESVSKQHS